MSNRGMPAADGVLTTIGDDRDRPFVIGAPHFNLSPVKTRQGTRRRMAIVVATDTDHGSRRVDHTKKPIAGAPPTAMVTNLQHIDRAHLLDQQRFGRKSHIACQQGGEVPVANLKDEGVLVGVFAAMEPLPRWVHHPKRDAVELPCGIAIRNPPTRVPSGKFLEPLGVSGFRERLPRIEREPHRHPLSNRRRAPDMIAMGM